MSKRINRNDLLPWFTMDHDQLPDVYLKSTQKLLDGLQVDKPQASSSKLQAPSLTDGEG